MSKHTPETWEHVQDIAGSRVVIDGYGFSAPYRLGPGSGVCPLQVADNTLIAAAPELLEALVESVRQMDIWEQHGDEDARAWRAEACAAIAKARGES